MICWNFFCLGKSTVRKKIHKNCGIKTVGSIDAGREKTYNTYG